MGDFRIAALLARWANEPCDIVAGGAS